YPPDFTPLPSTLRPHCAARDRLKLWLPPSTHTLTVDSPLLNLSRIQEVLIQTWADITHESYGSGLLAFHAFCDARGVSDSQRAPTHSDLISLFITYLTGSYSGKTISNYVCGVRAWHILHSQAWSLNDLEIDALLSEAQRITPATSRRKKRQPYTVNFISAIRRHLHLDAPLDASVYSCLTAGFYAIARAGELTIPTLTSFNPKRHIKCADVRVERDRNNIEITVLHVPETKTNREGEDLSFLRQAPNNPTDPWVALDNHFVINEPLLNLLLFSYRFNGSHGPLTKAKFTQ
ncbi:hypothetical protein PAXRUDRAFT_160762, partial [Paxillus rubicundulus Ve08.2h10]